MNLCLTAIVKNEAPIIARMLNSVLPHISYYSISDTGSTDGTQDIIRECLKGFPGLLVEDEWVDFSTNRNLALSRAVGSHVITVDADELLWRTGNEELPDADRISIKVSQSGMELWSPRILRNDGKWKWTGLVHELPDVHDGPYIDGLTERFEIQTIGDGNQSVTDGKGEKILALLERSPRTARTLFYLGRTLYELKRYEEAIGFLESHVQSDAHEEEKYISLYQIGAAKRMLECPSEEVIQAYARAYEFRPSRGEALYSLCHALRESGEIERARTLINNHRPVAEDTLFLDPFINLKLQEILDGTN